VDQSGLYITNASSSALFPNVWTNGGDFDTSVGGAVDGPYINKADESSVQFSSRYNCSGYFTFQWCQPQWCSVGAARFSPYRQIPSAGVFGSLPVGLDPSNPSITNAWRTLLFCPNPNASNRVAGNPPDYMLMDLFNLPVVQPYPISEPFSTAGRVNLNYQIAPFNYINRDSALRGVLKSVDMAAIPESQAFDYKGPNLYSRCIQHGPPNTTNNNFYYYRYPIHLNETLKQISAKFSTNGFFRSGAEICSVWLYPANPPGPQNMTNPAMPLVTDMAGSTTNLFNWWYGGVGTTRKGVTGDNQRERPYALIYPQITTKSNTYQIHYRVQTLKQTATAHPSDWSTWIDPGTGGRGITDKVVGELRGSAVIERYIDPSNPNLPDFATNVTSSGISGTPMDSFYKFRVFNARQFTP
jgi:uncharacterized protein (TIGR02600 family)